DQRDAEALGLGAGGGVVGLFPAQVGLDERVAQSAEQHAARYDARFDRAARRIEQRDRGVEVGGAAAQRPQLSPRVRVVAGLAVAHAVAGRDLIRADDQVVLEFALQRRR